MVPQQVSFVERLSLSQRVPYRRFHCKPGREFRKKIAQTAVHTLYNPATNHLFAQKVPELNIYPSNPPSKNGMGDYPRAARGGPSAVPRMDRFFCCGRSGGGADFSAAEVLGGTNFCVTAVTNCLRDEPPSYYSSHPPGSFSLLVVPCACSRVIITRGCIYGDS